MDERTFDDTTVVPSHESATAAPQPAASDGEQARELNLLLDEMPLGMLGLDYEGRCVTANRAAIAFLGIVVSNPVGRDIGNIIPSSDLRIHVNDALQLSRDGYPSNWMYKQRGRIIEMRSSATHEADRLSSVVIVLEDVTWKREVDAHKDEFLALVSHELRTPLTVIKGYLDIFARGMMGEMNDQQMESTQLMLQQCMRLEDLIRDLIRFRNISNGSSNTPPEVVPIAMFLQQVEAHFEEAVEQAGMSMSVDVRDPELACWCNTELLHDALRHLVDNAIKFAADGKRVRIATKAFRLADLPPMDRRVIQREPPSHTEWVSFSVIDMGPGIARDKLKLIFDSFEQIEDHMTRRSHGMGLGLSLVKKIVDAAGGTLWVDTEEGHGLKVNFILPQIHPSAR